MKSLRRFALLATISCTVVTNFPQSAAAQPVGTEAGVILDARFYEPASNCRGWQISVGDLPGKHRCDENQYFSSEGASLHAEADGNAQTVWLISPPIHLQQAISPVLGFLHQFQYQRGFAITAIAVAGDSGKNVVGDSLSWKTLHAGVPPNFGWHWKETCLSLAAYRGQTIQIAFQAQIEGRENFWKIARVQIVDLPAASGQAEFFTVESFDREILIRWKTQGRQASRGFEVYRAADRNGNYYRIDSYRRSQSLKLVGAPPAASFTFSDQDLCNGLTYWYKIVAVDPAGNEQISEPIAAVPGRRHRSDQTVLFSALTR